MAGNRVSWIDHKGEKILFTDYSNAAPDEIIATVKDSISAAKTQKEKSLLQIVDVTNANYNKDSWQILSAQIHKT